MANGSLWTPDGEVQTREKDIIPINQKELILLGHLHEFAQKYRVGIHCQACGKDINGANNDSPSNRTPSVACQCREWRFYRDK